ncbi:hypothetical protein EDD28_1485 [Salana multivorans]|uniref:Trehalase n=1 Tax=Salana multivorans TaxID=120377 RepID=A0A3N2DAW3_9MICO|nr:hypothetical protein [Salana multivorans]ROR96893.1 hypothetical protein EDD28_1485 [Salana multivorans]
MTIRFEGEERLERCVPAALRNLLEVNTVPGRGPEEPARFLRAGGGYAEPWTRDAAVNSWFAASWLTPDVAEATLRMVCEDGPDGAVVAQDDQWWDHVVWVVAAHRHALLTGDRAFLGWAEGVARRSLSIARAGRYVARFGLFRGPAVMADGISGYPVDVVEPGNESSFVLDHPRAHDVLCLSTNLVHAAAYRALGAMADALGGDGAADRAMATDLMRAVEKLFWTGTAYGYLLVPRGDDPADARLDTSQEALGLALALLTGHASGPRALDLVARTHREPFGVVSVWPHLQLFSDRHPGRHNTVVWPWITGAWVQAVAHAGDLDAFGAELDGFLRLVAAGGHAYPEVQNARTGAADGGWQSDAGWRGDYLPGIGRAWASEPDQTWSATALLGVLVESLLGLHPGAAGIRVAPRLPAGIDRLRLSGLRYGSATLDVEVRGTGDRLVDLVVDGTPVDVAAPLLPAGLRDGAPRAVVVTAVVNG